MREILFRGKRRDTGEWVEGYFLQDTEFYGRTDEHAYIVNHKHPSSCFGSDIYYEVDPETVSQFTGRTDKNRKKVFEGDILQLYTIWENGTVEPGWIVYVHWNDNDQCYVLCVKDGAIADDFGNLGRPEYYEVIGNIHDNPELIGERGRQWLD